jgi:hypothetical protein
LEVAGELLVELGVELDPQAASAAVSTPIATRMVALQVSPLRFIMLLPFSALCATDLIDAAG